MIKYAKVTTVDGEKYRLTFLGEENETPFTYPKIGVYTPQLNDIVCVMKDELGKYFCLGSVSAYSGGGGESPDSVAWGDIIGKPNTFPPNVHYHKTEEISNFPTSLPASGGNADTVDNKHATDFLSATSKGVASKGITIPTIGGQWISGKTASQVLEFTGNSTGDYHPLTRYLHKSGNVSNIGAIREQIGFWGYKSATTANQADAKAYLAVDNNTWYCDNIRVGGTDLKAKITELETKVNQLKGENKRVFTSNASFTVPTGVSKIYVTACGGGAGGKGAGRYSNGGGSGGNGGVGAGGGSSGKGKESGGGGAAIYRQPYNVTAGQAINITIGNGGSGSTDLMPPGNGGSTVLSGLVTLAGGTGTNAGGVGGGAGSGTMGGTGGSGICGAGGTGNQNSSYGSTGGGGSLGAGGGGGGSNYGTAGRGGTCSPLALYGFGNGANGAEADGIAKGGNGGKGIVIIEFI